MDINLRFRGGVRSPFLRCTMVEVYFLKKMDIELG